MNRILDYLEELYPDAKCELNYNKDYELLIAIVLSAQTTDKAVNKVTPLLFKKYDSLEKLSKANIKDIENILKPIGTYKKKSIYVKEIATVLHNNNDYIPNDKNFLIKLPGVGRKTINVFLSNIYLEPLIGVDTHVTRVSKRLNIVDNDADAYQVEKKLMELVPKNRWIRLHHQMVLFGRYKCKAIKPDCQDCKLKDICKKEPK